ncbi:MAG: pyridoxal phosphate-dependent aminotransferase [Xanthomonadaceae bacterium]|jgi:polar amino acid transport system ATP-binding protein/arginine:pyruvate transaminase|nr:pyridoxal phosphate-dependent aminotransferase [Xanthomonadaceae bacterium]
MRFSSLTDRIDGPGVAAWQIHNAAMQGLREGRDIIALSVGDPSFATPQPICDRAIDAIQSGDTHYTAITGKPELRQAIARLYTQHFNLPIRMENVAVSAGAQNGIFTTALCLLNPGDDALALEPVYLTYAGCLEGIGARMLRAPMLPDQDFRLDLDALRSLVTPRTRAIFLANPNNPTGRVLSMEELEAIAELARTHDLWVVVDEVYRALVFDGDYLAMHQLPDMRERTVTIGSLSKSHAMTGWRSGWIVAPEPLIEHIDRLALNMLYGLPGFIQTAMVEAVHRYPEFTAEMRARYRRRRDIVTAELGTGYGIQVRQPMAGMFSLIDVRASGMTSGDFAWSLFREQNVSTVDAEAFSPGLAGFIRIAYGLDEEPLREGCRRIAHFAKGAMRRP